jgi:2-oxoglutarate dehydrogenase E1 component
MQRMTNLKTVVWCQEEPKNNGAWFFVAPLLEDCLAEVGGKVARARYAGRRPSAATATGLARKHAEQQAALVAEALGHQVKG